MPRKKAEPKKAVRKTKIAKSEDKLKSRKEVLKEANRKIAEKEIAEKMMVERVSAFAQIKDAQKTGKILYANMAGAEIKDVSHTNAPVKTEYFAVLNFEGVKVLVPFIELYKDNPINTSIYHGFKTLNADGKVDASSVYDKDAAFEYNRRQRSIIENMYGYKTPFNVMRVETEDSGDYAIWGSRKRAIRTFARASFSPRENGETKLKVGDIVDAVIISIGTGGVWVNVGGVDCSMKVGQLTYKFVGLNPVNKEMIYLSRYFTTGETIKVQIMDIKQTPNGPEVIVSGRPIELLKAQENNHLIKPPMENSGTIVKIEENKTGDSLRLLVYIESLDRPAVVPAYIPRGGRKPEKGLTAYLTITKIHESGMLIADCRTIPQR